MPPTKMKLVSSLPARRRGIPGLEPTGHFLASSCEPSASSKHATQEMYSRLKHHLTSRASRVKITTQCICSEGGVELQCDELSLSSTHSPQYALHCWSPTRVLNPTYSTPQRALVFWSAHYLWVQRSRTQKPPGIIAGLERARVYLHSC